nr:MerR family transcriptional regulator [Paenibacillus sp. MER 99-2]
MTYVVENLNVSAKTLRFYEEQGILPNIARDEKGRRVYSEQQIEWISFIRCLKETGMPLSKIKEYQELFKSGSATYGLREQILINHKLEVQKNIEKNLKHLEEVNYKLAMYELQREEAMSNPDYNFKCHGMESKKVN